MNYSDEASYINMVSHLRSTDLQALLGAFSGNKVGRKHELRNRVLDIIKNKPPGFNINEFLAKIAEIYQHLQNEKTINSDLVLNMFDSQLQNVQAVPHHQQQQRMYQPAQHQYAQQPMLMPRVIMPQTQRAMYGSISMPHYLQTDSRNMITRNPNMTQPELMKFNTNLRSISSNSPIAKSAIVVKFKKLPFYEVLGDVLKPTVMIGQHNCTSKFTTEAMKEAAFKVVLTADHCTLISMNRDISNGKNEYIYQVKLRICQIQQDCTDVIDYLPLGLQIRFNNVYALPPIAHNTRPGIEARRILNPIDCTTFLKLCPNVTNTIILNWIPDGKTYIVYMHLAKRLTSDILLKAIQEKRSRSSEETKNYIIKKLTDVDPDLATTNYRFSLLCPLSKMRMKIPAKSINCDHLQCFDAISFLQMNEKKPTWTCPTCNNPCLYDDIRIENYFLEVVLSPKITDNVKEIEILPDGTWKVYVELEDCKSVSGSSEKLIDTVDLDDSDNSSDYPTKDLKSLNSIESENVRSSCIKLALSVVKESPREKEKQENEAQVANAVLSATDVNLNAQAKAQPKQAVTTLEQEVIEIDSPSPPTSPIPTTSAS